MGGVLQLRGGVLFSGRRSPRPSARGWIDGSTINIAVVFAGLTGAIVWNLITWLLGLPTSSSHALVGGVAGAAVAKAGPSARDRWIGAIPIFLFLSPIMGFCWVPEHGRGLLDIPPLSPSRVAPGQRLQLISAGIYSLGHGGNDAQKTMGIIFVCLIAAGKLPHDTVEPPMWIVLACHTAMGLGTLMGGWRIVKTMGQRICKLQPVHGFRSRERRCPDLVRCHAPRHPGIDHAHDHRCDRRRRLDARNSRRQVGSRHTRGVGLGANDSRCRGHRGRLVLDLRAARLAVSTPSHASLLTRLRLCTPGCAGS